MRTRTLLTVTAALSLLILAGCGSGTENGEATEDGAANTQMHGGSEETMDASSPDALAEQTFKLYMQAMQECTEALADNPDSATAVERVTAIRDKYAEQLVAIGKKREALDEQGKMAFDRALFSQMSNNVPPGTFEKYQEVQSPYSTDPNAGKLTNSINIITQYTNFDLLSKQEPEEAQKYGVYKEQE